MRMKKWLALVMVVAMMVCMLPAAPLGILADDITYDTVYDVNFMDAQYAEYTSAQLNDLVRKDGYFKSGYYSDPDWLAELQIAANGLTDNGGWSRFAQLVTANDVSNFRMTMTMYPNDAQAYNIGVGIDRNADGAKEIPGSFLTYNEKEGPILGTNDHGGVFFSVNDYVWDQPYVLVKGGDEPHGAKIPNPTEGDTWKTQIQGGAAVAVTQHENEIILSVGGTTAVRVVLDSSTLEDGVYTAGTVYDTNDEVILTFKDNAVLAKGMTGLFVRGNNMNLKSLKLETERKAIGKADLQAVVDAANALNIADYTEASWAAVKAALVTANDLLGQDAPEEATVISAIDGLNAATAALVSKLFEGDGTEFEQTFADSFDRTEVGANWAGDVNGQYAISDGKLAVTKFSALNTVATYQKATYSFQYAVKSPGVHSGFALRTYGDGNLYGAWSQYPNPAGETIEDKAQGLAFSVYPETTQGAFVIMPVGADLETRDYTNSMYAASKYTISYPNGFDYSADNTYTVADYGSYITFAVNGVPTAIVTLTGYTENPDLPGGGYYTGGSVLNAKGEKVGEDFEAVIYAGGSLCFDSRVGTLSIDDVVISTPKVVQEIAYTSVYDVNFLDETYKTYTSEQLNALVNTDGIFKAGLYNNQNALADLSISGDGLTGGWTTFAQLFSTIDLSNFRLTAKVNPGAWQWHNIGVRINRDAEGANEIPNHALAEDETETVQDKIVNTPIIGQGTDGGIFFSLQASWPHADRKLAVGVKGNKVNSTSVFYIPNPTDDDDWATQIQNGEDVVVVDHENEVSLSVGGTTIVKVVLDESSLANGVYTAGEVFDADGASLGKFTDKYVPTEGMVGLFVRANIMNVKALKLEMEQVAENVDKTDLQAAVDNAATNYIAAYYTADSIAAYEAAIANAKTLLVSPTATQEDIDNALAELDNSKLVESADNVGKIETIESNASVVTMIEPSVFEATAHDPQTSDKTVARLQWDGDTQQRGDAGMVIKFKADKAGYKDLTINYDFAHPTGQPVYTMITPNDDSDAAIVAEFTNNANGVWGRYQQGTVTIPVVKGENTVRISSYQTTGAWQIYVNYVILGETTTDSGALAEAIAKLPTEQGNLDDDTWNVYQSVKEKAESAATSGNVADAEDAIASIEAALAGDFVGKIVPNMPMTSILEPTKIVPGYEEQWNDYEYAWYVVADPDNTTYNPMTNGVVVKFYSADAGEKEVTFMANGADSIGDNKHRVSFVMNEGETNSATKADASATFEKCSWYDKYELKVTVPVKAGLNVMRIANDNIVRSDCRVTIPYIVLGETKPVTNVQYSELFNGDGTVFAETFTDNFERTELGAAWGGAALGGGAITITGGKLTTSAFASANTTATYEKAIYNFKYQITVAGNRKGFGVRVNGHGDLYGNYGDNAQGLLFDIVGGDENDSATYANNFVIVPIEKDKEERSKYKIPYPAGFNTGAEHIYTVADYGSYITYKVDGVPTAIVQFTDYNAATNTYGGGKVLDAEGTQIGEPFVASIPASGSLAFASRTATIQVDDVSISTPVDVVEPADLQDAVDAAKALNSTDYTTASWEKVSAAIAAAEAVLANGEATADELETAINGLDAATAALVSKLFEGDRTRFAEVFSDDFSADSLGTEWENDDNGNPCAIVNGKVQTNGISSISTKEKYGMASYSFKAAATTESTHAGFGLRALKDGDLYGDYTVDKGQGILFDIIPQTDVNGSAAYANSFVVVVLDADTDNETTVDTAFATAGKYAIPYPAGFDPAVEHDYKVVDYGNYITITVDGVPTAIITLDGLVSDENVAEGGYYTGGAVLNAAGVELGSFEAIIPASGSLVFASRFGHITVDDVKISTPADPLEPEYKVTFTPNGNSMWTATVAITGGVFTNGSISIDYDAAKTVLMKADGTAAATDADAFADIVSAAAEYGVYIENTDNTNKYNWIDTTDGHVFLNWQANGPKIDATEGYVDVATLIFKVDAPEDVTVDDFAVVTVAEGDYENWTAGAELVDEYLDLYAYGSEDYPLLVTFDFPEVYGAFITVTGGVASATSAAAGTEVTLTPQPAPGYELASWEVLAGDITITDNKFIMPAVDVSVKAIFQKITYNITVEGGSYTGTPQIGETITLTAQPDPGYELVGWEVVPNSITITDNTFTMPASDVTVKAIFDKERLNITISNATYEGEPVIGELITLKAIVPEGKVLLGWNVITPSNLQIIKNVFIMPGVDVEIEPIFGDEDTDYTVSGTVEYMSKGKDTVTITFTDQYYTDRVTVVETDVNGNFSVELAAGVYRVVFETAGHLTTTYVSYAVDGNNTLNEELYTGDVNGDNAVTNVDLAYVVLAVSGYNAIADINLDGVADIDDLVAVSANLGRKAIFK